MNIENVKTKEKNNSASDNLNSRIKQRQESALAMATVQVHQLPLALQWGSSQQQTAVLFLCG